MGAAPAARQGRPLAANAIFLGSRPLAAAGHEIDAGEAVRDSDMKSSAQAWMAAGRDETIAAAGIP